MSISVSDMLTLKSCGHFTIMAGTSGLTRSVDIVDMLDFGWERDKTYSQPLFEKHSFAISSLMFAKDEPEKLFITIQSMIKCGVVGLAFKPVFYKKLPDAVRRLADQSGFIIFRIDDNIPYREIICDVADAIKINEDISETSGYLMQLLNEELDEAQVTALAVRLSPSMQAQAGISLIMPEDSSFHINTEQIIRSFREYLPYRNKVILCRFASGIAVVTTANTDEAKKFDVPVDYIREHYLDKSINFRTISGGIHPTYSQLHLCIREAYDTWISSLVMDRRKMAYSEIGTLSFLIPAAASSALRDYSRNFLKPILTDEEYMKTAAEFVRAGGDFEKAAEQLICHKNTIRYRINKMKGLLAPEVPYETFYERLASAVKIFLINNIVGKIDFN